MAKIKIDFQLNRQFGVVERTIFRLVLNGFRDANEISCALPVFSDSVIANSIKYLVNRQIISANITEGTLSLSEPLLAIIDKCIERTYEIDIPHELIGSLNEDGFIISGAVDEANIALNKAIMYELLPDVKLDMYIDSLDFIIYEEQGGQDE